jgi:hypothetical protein
MSSSDRIKYTVQAAFVHSTSPEWKGENYPSSFIKDTFSLFASTYLSTDQTDRNKDELHKKTRITGTLREGQYA